MGGASPSPPGPGGLSSRPRAGLPEGDISRPRPVAENRSPPRGGLPLSVERGFFIRPVSQKFDSRP